MHFVLGHQQFGVDRFVLLAVAKNRVILGAKRACRRKGRIDTAAWLDQNGGSAVPQ